MEQPPQLIHPIEMLGPVECRICRATMILRSNSETTIFLDKNGLPYDVTESLSEMFLICPKCGHIARYNVDPKTRTYSIIDSINRSNEIDSREQIESFEAVTTDMNPFIIKDILGGN